MFLSKITLTCLIILSFALETCYSSRTKRLRRPDDYDDDDEEDQAPISSMELAQRTPQGRFSRHLNGAFTIDEEITCDGYSFFTAFYVLWEWTAKGTIFPTKVEPCFYGVNIFCENQKEVRLLGTYRWASGRGPKHSTGRWRKLIYWTVNNKIYQFDVTGSFRTSVWETTQWQEGEKKMWEVECPPENYMFHIRGVFLGTTHKKDYILNIQSRCRSVWPAGQTGK